MKTLKQRLKKLFPKYAWQDLANEITKEVKEWLQDHKADIGNKIYSGHRVIAETIFDELVGELKG